MSIMRIGVLKRKENEREGAGCRYQVTKEHELK